MKIAKSFAAATLLFAAGSSVMAEEFRDGFFLGVGYERDMVSKFDATVSAFGTTSTVETEAEDYNVLAFKAGYDFKRFRTAFNYRVSQKKDDLQYSSYGLSLAYMPEIATSWRANVGAHYNIGKHTSDSYAQSFSESGIGTYTVSVPETDFDSSAWGLDLGGIYEIDLNNEIEFGYRYSKHSFDSESVTYAFSGALVGSVAADYDPDDATVSTLYLGYNYKF